MSELSREKLPVIGVDLELAYGWQREVLNGVLAYAQQHGPWEIRTNPPMGFGSLRGVHAFRGAGLITQDYHTESVRSAEAAGLPVVRVFSHAESIQGCLVTTDMASVARMQIEHLLNCGYQHIAIVAAGTSELCQNYLNGANDFLREAGVDPSAVYQHACEVWPIAPSELQTMIQGWIRQWPRPIGVAADQDGRAASIVSAAHTTGQTVPVEIGVIGLQNDPFITQAVRPALTSVVQDDFHIGYEAARRLDGLIKGESVPESSRHFFTPLSIEQRGSTSVFAIDDPRVVTALGFLRENLSIHLTRDEIGERVNLSGRQLDTLFKKYIGRTVADELRQARLSRVRELLRQTDLSMAHIAAASGYADQTAMGVAFRKAEGMTPSAFRRQRDVEELLGGTGDEAEPG